MTPSPTSSVVPLDRTSPINGRILGGLYSVHKAGLLSLHSKMLHHCKLASLELSFYVNVAERRSVVTLVNTQDKKVRFHEQATREYCAQLGYQRAECGVVVSQSFDLVSYQIYQKI